MGGGHVLRRLNDIIFCRRCGRYSSKNVADLTKPCKGPPRAPGTISRLRRMCDGRDPRTDVPIGAVTDVDNVNVIYAFPDPHDIFNFQALFDPAWLLEPA